MGLLGATGAKADSARVIVMRTLQLAGDKKLHPSFNATATRLFTQGVANGNEQLMRFHPIPLARAIDLAFEALANISTQLAKLDNKAFAVSSRDVGDILERHPGCLTYIMAVLQEMMILSKSEVQLVTGFVDNADASQADDSELASAGMRQYGALSALLATYDGDLTLRILQQSAINLGHWLRQKKQTDNPEASEQQPKHLSPHWALLAMTHLRDAAAASGISLPDEGNFLGRISFTLAADEAPKLAHIHNEQYSLVHELVATLQPTPPLLLQLYRLLEKAQAEQGRSPDIVTLNTNTGEVSVGYMD